MARPALTEKEIRLVRERAAAAGLKLFESGGLDAVNLRILGKALGLSAMALYRYFPGGKRDIIDDMRVECFEAFASVLSAAHDQSLKPTDQIKRIFAAAAEYGLKQPARYQLMFQYTFESDHDPSSAISQARARCWPPIESAFSALAESADLCRPPHVLAHLTTAAVHGLISFHLSEQPYPERRIENLDSLIDIFLEGAKATQGNRE